jgi:hypothetical protein
MPTRDELLKTGAVLKKNRLTTRDSRPFECWLEANASPVTASLILWTYQFVVREETWFQVGAD